ncbi:hypothetical protein WDW89_20965 [Deltaproteobacteria bacterium TL4]
MLHIGVIAGNENQADALIEIHKNSQNTLFSKQNSFLSSITSEELNEGLPIDVLFYVLPVSKLGTESKSNRATLKWIRELRNYSSVCTRKPVKDSRHLLIGDVTLYLEQIQKMDLDLSVRFQEESEWQSIVSVEQAFKQGQLVAMPALKAIIDKSGNPCVTNENELISVNEISHLIFQEAPPSDFQLHALRLVAETGPQPIEKQLNRKLPVRDIESFVFKQSGKGRVSFPLSSINSFKVKQKGSWSLELSDLWQIRNKILPSGKFQLRLDTATFEDLIIDEKASLNASLNKVLHQIPPNCENFIWQQYTEAQMFSLHERPVLIAIEPDLAEILAQQLKFTGFKNISLTQNAVELERSLQACNIPGHQQKKVQSEKSTFPTIITTKSQQVDIKRQYPAIKCYAIPELELMAPKDAKQKEEWNQLKAITEQKINEMLQEAAGHPLQSFYLNIVQLFFSYLHEENSTDLIGKLQETTLSFLKNLPLFFQAELDDLNLQKQRKQELETQIAQDQKNSEELVKNTAKQEQEIERLNRILTEKQVQVDQLLEHEKKLMDYSIEFLELSSNRKSITAKAKTLQRQIQHSKQRIAQTQAEHLELQKKIKHLDKAPPEASAQTTFFGVKKEDPSQKLMLQLRKEREKLKNYFELTNDLLKKDKIKFDEYRSQLQKTQDRYNELNTLVNGTPNGEQQQTSNEVIAGMQRENEVLGKLLRLNEEQANELKILKAAQEVAQKKLAVLTRDIIGQELAFNKEKQEAEDFGKKIITWITNLSQSSNIKESLSELEKQAEGGFKEITELIEMINKLMTLRKIQDKNQSLVSIIMKSLDMQFSFYHVPNLKNLGAPLVFIGDQMKYPFFAAGLMAMFQLNIKKGQIINWEKFQQEQHQFARQIIIIDFSNQSGNELMISKVRELCFKSVLQNFFIALLPEDQLFDEKWYAFRSLALCLPANHLETFLSRPFFKWLDAIKEIG